MRIGTTERTLEVFTFFFFIIIFSLHSNCFFVFYLLVLNVHSCICVTAHLALFHSLSNVLLLQSLSECIVKLPVEKRH